MAQTKPDLSPKTDEATVAHELEAIFEAARPDIGDTEIAVFKLFLSALYENIHVSDILKETPIQHAARAVEFWQWGQRAPKFPHLRVMNPPESGGSWRQDVTHIDIITRDKPFLVDSVMMEMVRLGLEIRFMLHPIFSVAREKDGQLAALKPLRTENVPQESWIHVSVTRQSEAELEKIHAALLKVLADVDLVVADWPPMRKGLAESVAALPKDGDENKENLAFLEWLDNHHFVFLGMRDYVLTKDGASLEVTHSNSLGLLRDPAFHIFNLTLRMTDLSQAVREFLSSPQRIFVNKARPISTVHRATQFDIVGVKNFDSKGRFTGFRLFAGLFSSIAYARSAQDIPLLRRKVEAVVAKSGFGNGSHNGKALFHILNNYPRDDLFQITVDELYPIARGILTLAERQRTTLFVWKDPFDRFWSCLIYTPRERYDSILRARMVAEIEDALKGPCRRFTTGLSDSPLVRVQAFIDIPEGSKPVVPDLVSLERRLIDIARGWDEKLADALVVGYGQSRGLALRNLYSTAFPSIYRDSVTPAQAARDVLLTEKVRADNNIAVSLTGVPGEPQRLDLRLYHNAMPLALSDILPPLENLGLRVLTEVPYCLVPRDGGNVWVQDLKVEMRSHQPVDADAIRANFLEAARALWTGEMEDDGFNRLILGAGITPREATIFRAYGKYLQQARFLPTQAFIQETLAAHPEIAANLIRLFHARHDPLSTANADDIAKGLQGDLEKVEKLAEDEVLRRLYNLIECTLRTNYYQNKPYISFKIDSQKVTDLPAPRPLVEIWVYSARMEGVHLRGGRVARGGIRWSDRPDDFRTEILGLMKAQMVKNSVIVPVGSKGGFYCKKLPIDPKAQKEEVIACYQTLIRGLLDLTDNSTMKGIEPPHGIKRLDGDDPYLVVAADKGTASFSDIANALSAEYHFWLDDAFASGGSAGYDHKHMGITARGAWEAIKRHFREIGVNIQTTPFTCIGVGDMAGDVFGNGMLLSQQTLLIAAFNHKHIFIDPNPDAAASYTERKRLFEKPGSQWSDYDTWRISKGGGVLERSAKSITLTPEMKKLLDLNAEKLTPAELIRAILVAQADLLYLGGIGTYIKSTEETHAEVNDKANDALRINAADLRVKVVGEGANLGVTPRARIEFARAKGHINSDAIDNSAGVDTSDHEVNIKIVFASEMAQNSLKREDRNKILTQMTDDVGALVLRDNYLQTQTLSIELLQAPQLADAHARLLRTLEKAGRLDRAVEFLPNTKQLAARAAEGLTRPEIALLMAHAKMALFDDLIKSTLPDDPAVLSELPDYFPSLMREKYASSIISHRLRREIIATVLANDVVNRMGTTFVFAVAERSGAAPADVVRAWRVVREAYNLPELWAEIESLDNKAPAHNQLKLLADIIRLSARAVGTVLSIATHPLDIKALTTRLQPALAELKASLPNLAPPLLEGIPTALMAKVEQLETLSAGPDILVVADAAKVPVAAAAKAYAEIDIRFRFGALRERALERPISGHWQRQAVSAAIDDLYQTQQQLAVSLIKNGKGNMVAWVKLQADEIARFDVLLTELRTSPELDLAMLTVAGKALRGLAEI